MSDYFSDFDEETTSTSSQTSLNTSSEERQTYSNEVFSEKISAKHRTFFVDVKENHYGHLVKISEKSRGKKSTIMMDAEDLDDIIAALTNARNFIANEK